MTSPKAFLVFLVLAFVPLMAVSAQQKFALVIGNSAYTSITRLNNPENDAIQYGEKYKHKPGELRWEQSLQRQYQGGLSPNNLEYRERSGERLGSL